MHGSVHCDRWIAPQKLEIALEIVKTTQRFVMLNV